MELFAVMRLNDRQIKVITNDRIQMEKLPFEIGDQICIEDVLMIGTTDYTAIGRPRVQNARVFATLEELASTEKTLIFKKRRRKGYQKTQGHRQEVHVLRVDRIEHDITADFFRQQAEETKDQAKMGNL